MNEAIVLKVGNRFYVETGKKRISTAWSLAGATLYGAWREDDIHKAEMKLYKKGYTSERLTVRIDL